MKIFLLLSLIVPFKLFSQESALLDTNDISARIYAEGSLFNGKFEVPKGSHENTIYAANLWIGGYDELNNLHVAAQSYYSKQFNQDYFYGPIAYNYNDSGFINRYNRVWKINKSEIDFHKANFNQTGYVMPASILGWPGTGNLANGEAEFLAPFVDANSNRIYDPENGDYPEIRGDQAVYFIANDAKSVHTNSNADLLGIEIHGLVYSFASNADSALSQTIFINYKIINRSINNYSKVYVGVFSDMDIGDFSDDNIGSDSLLNMSYAYNGNAIDNNYGNHPPAQGLIILNYPMSSFMYYNNPTLRDPPAATVDPTNAIEYYRYTTGKWKNGTPLTKGGLGFNPGSIDTAKFAFSGDPNGTGWVDPLAFDEKNGINNIGPFEFKAGSSICLDIAFPYARDYNGTNLTSISLLKQRVKSIQSFYNNQSYSCSEQTTSVKDNDTNDLQISIYPNPSNGIIHIGLNSLSSNNHTKIKLYNIFGQKVYQSTTQQVTESNIDVSHLSPGIYIVKIFSGQKNISEKVAIQN